MADISRITLPSGSTYEIKDAWARTQIEAITGGSALVFKGVSSTSLTDGGTENPTVDGTVVTEKSIGDIYFYGVGEYIWNGEAWNELGNLSNLGDLAYQDSASTSYQPAGTISTINFTGTTLSMNTSYQPAGTVSQPTFTGTTLDMSTSYTPAGSVAAPTISVSTAGATTTVKNPTAKTLPSELVTGTPSTTNVSNEITYCAVQDNTLLLYHVGYNTTDSITISDVTVKTGDASYTATAPAFTGTATTISVSGTPEGTVSTPTFTGTTATIAVEGTPEGSISTPTFTGTTATITVS